MLRVRLTDGKVKVYAVELEQIAGLGLKTPPGTKMLFPNTAVHVFNGFLLLTNATCHVLGGRVEHLLQVWQVQQSLVGMDRSVIQQEGRPPFVPFSKAFKHRMGANLDLFRNLWRISRRKNKNCSNLPCK